MAMSQVRGGRDGMRKDGPQGKLHVSKAREGAEGCMVRAYPGSGVGMQAQPQIHCVAQGP